ncbi:mitochondrial proline oxidase (proline dehydrogenase) [Andalucia godoyi]|uniref:Proline dehydrogenase n=1 Tax=Andalucia godoyi TaxID=505711 RepID=A0A8K0AH60_ANDGO|nr:mitochondrial proline oxidase (proline dehydrogenase) [Andalucia godoyi]|eukprot:ANDGO_00317.mRNA.1 mitochondrial proline oxidase (proline dehydrogenase)
MLTVFRRFSSGSGSKAADAKLSIASAISLLSSDSPSLTAVPVSPLSKLTTPSIVSSLAHLGACRISPLVKSAPAIIATASASGSLAAPVFWGIKHSFFEHFCAGETLAEVKVTLGRLANRGVAGIVDYSVEAESGDLDVKSSAFDSTVRVLQSAVRTAASFTQSIPASSVRNQASACLKISALGPVSALEHVSNALMQVQGSRASQALEETPNVERVFFSSSPVPTSTTNVHGDGKGTSNGWNVHQLPVSFLDAGEVVFKNPGAFGLVQSDVEEWSTTMRRLDLICEVAFRDNVCLYIDAEQWRMQPAMALLALEMMKKYNKSSGLIRSTYQMYLKSGPSQLVNDLQSAKGHGFVLGAKLVRGAYKDSERVEAGNAGRAVAIWDNVEETHASYDSGVAYAIQQIASAIEKGSRPPLDILVATHNPRTVAKALTLIDSLGLTSMVASRKADIGFGQLLGMADSISYTLADAHMPVAKYLPFGPVRQVMPYLTRRLQENSDIMGGTTREIGILQKELRRRLFVA